MAGIILLLIMVNRDPVRRVNHFVNNLARLNIGFTGYVRQIQQVDATFRGMYLSTNEFTIDQMEQTLERIQDSMDNALENVSQIMDEMTV